MTKIQNILNISPFDPASDTRYDTKMPLVPMKGAQPPRRPRQTAGLTWVPNPWNDEPSYYCTTMGSWGESSYHSNTSTSPRWFQLTLTGPVTTRLPNHKFLFLLWGNSRIWKLEKNTVSWHPANPRWFINRALQIMGYIWSTYQSVQDCSHQQYLAFAIKCTSYKWLRKSRLQYSKIKGSRATSRNKQWNGSTIWKEMRMRRNTVILCINPCGWSRIRPCKKMICLPNPYSLMIQYNLTICPWSLHNLISINLTSNLQAWTSPTIVESHTRFKFSDSVGQLI